MRNRLLLLFLSAFLLVGYASSQTETAQASVPQGYLIGPGDEITAKVLGEEQFDFVATVDQDGKIEVPFFDKPVDATCKSERDLRLEVSRLLSKYLKSPQVSLRVTQ